MLDKIKIGVTGALGIWGVRVAVALVYVVLGVLLGQMDYQQAVAALLQIVGVDG